MTLSEELTWRGFVNQTTFKSLTDLDKQPRGFYFGVDPSADSMQVGNLASAMMARCFMKHGYTGYLLVGGATGMIGDPDGKSQERDLLSAEQLEKNKQAIASQYRHLFAGQDFQLVDNYDWFKDMRFLTFLREVGKHVPMRQMLGREFVQTRLSEDGAGISYAEFSYVLIQAYDFLHLFREHQVSLQLCGSDQWGNSIAGVDLIRRMTGGEAHVYSGPLVINQATGKKFGKSESGAVWLDSLKTSPYQFYQFWLNTDDQSVEGYLKIFTPLDKEAVDKTMAEFQRNPGARLAQKALAFEATKLVHGQETAAAVESTTEMLFSGQALNESAFHLLKRELPTIEAQGQPLRDILVAANLATSKSDADRLVAGGAISIDGEKCAPQASQSAVEFSDGEKYRIIRRGKNQFVLVLETK